jgi:ribosomal protein L7/L12
MRIGQSEVDMENWVWILFVAIGLLALKELGSIARSVQGTEAMTRRLLSQQGVEWETHAEPSDRVKALATGTGTRIAAIQAYRAQTGLGLKEAMAVVDQLSLQTSGRT